MRTQLSIVAILMCVARLWAVTEVFHDTFENGSTEGWELQNCTLAVDSDDSYYLHGSLNCAAASPCVRLERRFSAPGWVFLESRVGFSGRTGMCGGSHGLLAGDGLDSHQVWAGVDGGGLVLTAYHYKDSLNSLIYRPACCCLNPSEVVKVHSLRALLMEEQDRIDVTQYVANATVDTGALSVTYHDLPTTEYSIWVVGVTSPAVARMRGVPEDATDEFTWCIVPVITPTADLTFTFTENPVVFGVDELTVFSFDYASTVASRAPAPKPHARAVPHSSSGTARYYDLAGRSRSTVPIGLSVQQTGGGRRCLVRLR